MNSTEAWDGVAAFGSGRQARAYAAWWAAGRGGMPLLAERRTRSSTDVAPGERLGGLTLLVGCGAETMPPMLAERIAACARRTEGPVRFRAEWAEEPAAGCWIGLLLPYADGLGRLAAIELVADHRADAAKAEYPSLADGTGRELSMVSSLAQAPNPWRHPTPFSCPAQASDRGAEARTWAALAAANPALRRDALARALQAFAAAGQEPVAALSAWIDKQAETSAATLRAALATFTVPEAAGDPGESAGPDAVVLLPLPAAWTARRPLPQPLRPARAA